MSRNIYFFLLLFVLTAGCKNPVQPGVSPEAEPKASVSPQNGKSKAVPGEQGGTNHAPVITGMDVTPLTAKLGDTLKVEATATDQDDDPIKFIYQWFKNDVQIAQESNSLTLTADFKRGDTISLNAIPDDGIEKGNPGKIIVTIGNSSPEITSSASDIKIVNRIFTYQVRAVDKDNDPLLYSLKNAPPAMTIDQATGLIQWNVPSDFKGKTSVAVSVTDGQGGDAVQSFAFEVAAENPPEK